MRLLSKLLTYIFIFILTIFVLEVFSFSALILNNLMKGEKLQDSLRYRMQEINATYNTGGYTSFGDYDPVAQIFLHHNNTYSGLEISKHGFITNQNEDNFLNTFPNKPKNLIRIIMLGGSTVAGLGVDKNNETLPAVLEKILNQKFSNLNPDSKLKFQVLNFGGAGGYTGNNYIRFTQYLMYFNPDILITFDGYNDAWNSTYEPIRKGLSSPIINWGGYSYSLFNQKNYEIKKNIKKLEDYNIKPVKFITFTSSLVLKFHKKYLSSYKSEKDIKKINENNDKLYKDYHMFNFSKELKKYDPYFVSVFENNLNLFGEFACNNKVLYFSFLQPYALAKNRTLHNKEMINIENWVEKKPYIKSTDEKNKLFKKVFNEYEKVYLKLNNKFSKCKNANYFSVVNALSDGEHYFIDPIHVQHKGNQKIAEVLLDKLFPHIAMKYN